MPDGESSFFHQSVFVTEDGAPLWFEQRGEGPRIPIVLCDGLGCDGFVWRYLWKPLTVQRQVLHWNYRGHGKSGMATDPTRIGVEYTCDDLNHLLDHLNIERAVIFGHSMGVQVSLEFHRRHPTRVAGLVLLCGSYGTPLDTWHDHTLLRVAFPKMRAAVERFPNIARFMTSRLLRTELAVELAIKAELNPILMNHSDFHPYMEHLARMDPLAFVRTLDSLKDHSALDHLPHVDVPSLVVGGEIDKFTPVWLSQRMSELLPGSTYLFVEGGSHTAPLERPGLVNEAIERLLEGIERVRATR